jgi:hypothetical protein
MISMTPIFPPEESEVRIAKPNQTRSRAAWLAFLSFHDPLRSRIPEEGVAVNEQMSTT